MSVTEIIKRFLAIVVDTLLQTAENIMLAVLDVFSQLTKGFKELLTASIEIPVISWLYNELTGDDLSFLDLICLIGAIPATFIYKATAHSAPFPRHDAFTNGLLDATSFDQVKRQFFAPKSLGTATATPARAMLAEEDAPVLDQTKLKVFGIVAGSFAFCGSIVLVITSAIQKALDLLGAEGSKVLASITCMGNIAYVSPNIATLINAKTDAWYAQLNNVITGISIAKGIVAIPLATTSNRVVQLIFPSVETLINIIWNVPVIANIVVNASAFDTTYKSLIPESIGNFAFNLGGIMELPIALIKDLKIKLVATAVQDGLMLTYGVLMVVAGGIYE